MLCEYANITIISMFCIIMMLSNKKLVRTMNIEIDKVIDFSMQWYIHTRRSIPIVTVKVKIIKS